MNTISTRMIFEGSRPMVEQSNTHSTGRTVIEKFEIDDYANSKLCDADRMHNDICKLFGDWLSANYRKRSRFEKVQRVSPHGAACATGGAV